MSLAVNGTIEPVQVLDSRLQFESMAQFGVSKGPN
jgi:hypothetical protein